MKKSLFIITACICVILTAYINTSAAEPVEKTAYADMFSLSESSERFILLDSDDEGFFVMTQMLYGTHLYDSNDQSKFDVENPANMAHWLNNGFLNEGNGGQKLPEEIISHLVERDWFVEESNPQSKYKDAYYVRAKIALLSSTEYDKYLGIFGYGDDKSQPYFFLRSSAPTATTENGAVMVCYTEKILKAKGKNFRYYGVRPVFYLDKDFFKRVRLNLGDAYFGDNIKKIIRENCSQTDLKAIYSREELNIIFNSPLKPIVSNVTVSGFPAAGSTLTASYKFYSPSGERDAGSVIRWVRSKNKDSGYRAIIGAKGASYTLTEADAGYYVKAEVVPKTKNQIGFVVSSPTPISMIFPDYKPQASNVYIIGNNFSGGRLILNYNYSDGNYDKERGSLFFWERSKDGKVFSPIKNANKVDYIISDDDVDCYLRAGVIVKNNQGTGDVVYAEMTEKIYKKPSAESLKITMENSYLEASYSFNSALEEQNSVIIWEFSEKEDGVYKTVSQGNKRISSVNLKGKYVRFSLIPCDKEGKRGDKISSNALKIPGESRTCIALSTQSLAVEAGNSLYTSGDIAPALISFIVNKEYEIIPGELYEMFLATTPEGIKYTFILKSGDGDLGSIELCSITEKMTLSNIRAVIYNSAGESTIVDCILHTERR